MSRFAFSPVTGFSARRSRYCLCAFLGCYLSVCLPAQPEAYNTGWRLNIDNNVLQRYMKDRDYTAGLAFTATGSRAQSGWLNIDALRAGLFDYLPLYPDDADIKKHSVQYGFTLFTPDDISTSQPVIDDRPFASLFFLSNTELVVDADNKRAFRSSLTVGFLGLDIAGDIQRVVHKATGSEAANGWDNQISSGGEPTAMMTLSVQQKQFSNKHHQLSTHLEGNAGFSTDLNAGINWRWGRLNTSWWSFNPSHNEYIASAVSHARSGKSSADEFYVFASANIKYRFYSSLLQGQFRHSAHTLRSRDIEPLITSVSIGINRQFSKTMRAGLLVRGASAEIKGVNARSLWWAGLVIDRAF